MTEVKLVKESKAEAALLHIRGPEEELMEIDEELTRYPSSAACLPVKERPGFPVEEIVCIVIPNVTTSKTTMKEAIEQAKREAGI